MHHRSVSTTPALGSVVLALTTVHRDGDAFAIYEAVYANNLPAAEIAMLVSIGAWGEDDAPSKRAAFFGRVRPSAAGWEVMLGNAADSVWGDVEIVGAKLSRAGALVHPWKSAAFGIVDQAMVDDPSLRGFLHRVECGDAAVPLEMSFAAPDDIAALGEAERGRAERTGSFAALDERRLLVRCLAPLPVEGHAPWNIGLWIEVTQADDERIRRAWDDAEAYRSLTFTGTLANDVAAALALPLPKGTEVRLHVREFNAPPMIVDAGAEALRGLLGRTWATAEFERHAVGRGFL